MNELFSDLYDEWIVDRGGLLLPPRFQRPVAIELFCGAGGMSLGLHQAGFHVIAAADNATSAAITYMVNLAEYPCQIHFIEPEDRERLEEAIHKEWKRYKLDFPVAGSNRRNVIGDLPGCRHFFFGDLSKITGRQILDAIGMEQGEVDLVAGGPPCQGFSIAGKRNVLDPRNDLTFHFIRLVLEIQPKAMMMENVPGLLSMTTPEGIPVIDAICRMLNDGGFGTYEALRKSLLTTSGAGLAMRRSQRSTAGPQEGDQVGLFAEGEEVEVAGR